MSIPYLAQSIELHDVKDKAISRRNFLAFPQVGIWIRLKKGVRLIYYVDL
jgi:hypothetical protein